MVRAADVMAYVAHDTDDALRGGVISAQGIPPRVCEVLGAKLSKQIDTMVRDLITRTSATGGGRLAMSPQVEEAMGELREFLYQNVYENMEVHADFLRASKVVKEIYEKLTDDDEFFQRHAGALPPPEDRPRRAADYIAGMTDRYALQLYHDTFLPKPWAVI